MNRSNRLTPWEEHYFWVNILLDHAVFVRDYLSPAETTLVNEANGFISRFATIRAQLQQISSQSDVSSQALIEFSKISAQAAYDYYRFEGKIMNLRINNEVKINITPTYFNGTTNENAEYLRILQYYMKGMEYPPLPLVDLLDLWLEDQLGHASLLRRSLDGVEQLMLERVNNMIKVFSAHMLKNDAIKGYLRFIQPNFSAQIQFAQDVIKTVAAFNETVEHILELYKDDEVFNSTDLRFLEHHFPESCYFLNKLSDFVPGMQPNCAVSDYFRYQG
ncbi:DUF2935 domain-containing protein [Bacillus sp. AK128]